MPPLAHDRRATTAPRALKLAVVLAVAATLGGAASTACTLLIPFDETSSSLDASSDADRGDATGETQDGASDAARDTSSIRSCDRKEGHFCATNGLVDYPGPATDLVECGDGGVISIRACTKGNGCLKLPSPQPDQCDDCAGRPNGIFCGRELDGWEPENDNVAVQCRDNRTVDTVVCETCISMGEQSGCQ